VQARDVCIAGHTVSVVESSLSDGLGARLWSVSFMLCRHAPTHETERERERERERTWLAEWEVERQTKARCDQAIPLQLNTIPC
jgi:hypothetical protein